MESEGRDRRVGLLVVPQLDAEPLAGLLLEYPHVGRAEVTLHGLEGGEPHENAARILGLLDRPASAPTALRSAVLLNAAAAIYVAGISTTFAAAVEVAVDSLESGRPRERLEVLRLASTS